MKLADTQAAIRAGADEIDMVIDRGAFLAGHHQQVFDEIVAVKNVCGDVHLKVILETGELGSYDNVRAASDLALRTIGSCPFFRWCLRPQSLRPVWRSSTSRQCRP